MWPRWVPKLVILHEPDLRLSCCMATVGSAGWLRQRHQGYIPGDKRIRLRQVKRLSINRSFPGRELFEWRASGARRALAIGRHLVGFTLMSVRGQ